MIENQRRNFKLIRRKEEEEEEQSSNTVENQETNQRSCNNEQQQQQCYATHPIIDSLEITTAPVQSHTNLKSKHFMWWEVSLMWLVVERWTVKQGGHMVLSCVQSHYIQQRGVPFNFINCLFFHDLFKHVWRFSLNLYYVIVMEVFVEVMVVYTGCPVVTG